MTDEPMKIAKRVQKNLSRSGIKSEIKISKTMIEVIGTDRSGKPFAVRVGQPTDLDGVADFADACDERRTHPRKPGDFILVRPLDA